MSTDRCLRIGRPAGPHPPGGSVSITRRVMLSATATTLVASALFAVSPAQAAQTPLTMDASAVAASIGDSRTAGSYVDSSGATVVNVTDAAAAKAISATGAKARIVQRSEAQLSALTASLD